MSPELQTALSALLGGFGMLVLKEWVPGLVRWMTGRSARQKNLIREAEEEAERFEKERDSQARIVRRLEIHGTALTRYLVQLGWDPHDPRLAWPKYD